MIQSFEGFNAFFWVFFSLSHALQPHCDNLFVTLLLEKYNKELSMKLSELHTGESGIIVKVTGHGGFRKRIVEMGFIKGQKVEVLLNAPLKDTVKYRVMGYEVSLRHSEANMIEVMTQEEYTRRMKAKSEAVTKDETTQAFEEESEQINNSNSTDEQALPHKHVSDDELKALDRAREPRHQRCVGGKSQLRQDLIVQFCLRRPRACGQLLRRHGGCQGRTRRI